MNLDGVGEEQIHTILVLVTLNMIVFVALMLRVQANFSSLHWCDLL
ncbi:MAG: hypothetical protein AAF282_11940 [Cyanobacteria bacterium P01_A01_bin.15]